LNTTLRDSSIDGGALQKYAEHVIVGSTDTSG
jgi:hypothetical protein